MRRLRLSDPGQDDPLAGMANLFDLGVVFALGFGIAILAQVSKHDPARAAEALKKSAAEEVPEQAAALKRFRSTDESLGGNGTRLGTAYRLANGEVVYVPEPGKP
jgi:hypothetical protein